MSVQSFYPVVVKKLNFQDPAASFDAVLYKAMNGVIRYKLSLQLRLRLEQVNPSGLSTYPDANGNQFSIRPWTGPEWSAFKQGALAQANMWKNKFSLEPPLYVTDFDYVDFYGVTWVYKVVCELDVTFDAKPEDAHRVIKVANLDTTRIPGAPLSRMPCSGTRWTTRRVLIESRTTKEISTP